MLFYPYFHEIILDFYDSSLIIIELVQPSLSENGLEKELTSPFSLKISTTPEPKMVKKMFFADRDMSGSYIENTVVLLMVQFNKKQYLEIYQQLKNKFYLN